MPRSLRLTLLLAACSTPTERAEPVPLSSFALEAPQPAGGPESPRIHRDLHRVDGDGFTSPLIPPNRTSADGRVSVNVQGGGPNLRLWLFVPEAVEEPLLSGPAGRAILPDPTGWTIPFDPEPHDMTGHHAVCDPTLPFPRPGERPNPYACGEGGAHDCYDLTIITNTVRELSTTFWGVDLVVEVANPKTAEARIVDVTAGEPVRGATLPASPEWSEANVTQDGRLLTGRAGSLPRSWTNPETGERRTDLYDLMYSVLPADAAPCDVTGWTRFHPMSHAPYDPEMIGTYPLADYPFRDSEGAPIADGEDLKGTYPWVDRFGRNVFMSAIPDLLGETPAHAYPRTCVDAEACASFVEATGTQKGYLVGGGWTHGRFVHLDALINHVDWAVGVAPDTHVQVALYEDGPTGGPTQVRVGGGRVGSGGDHVRIPGFGGNANILDSAENLYTWTSALTPGAPRDVVWTMNTGVSSDEVVFDDLLDPDAFVVSDMTASITALPIPLPPKVVYWNGLVRSGGEAEFTGEMHVQNAATAPAERWIVPSYGLLPAGAGRIEPVAMGGIRGKGLWLNGASGVTYPVPVQPRSVRDHDWYVGVFVDPRRAEASVRTVLTFPDGSRVSVHDRDTVLISSGDQVVAELVLPEPLDQGWTHLGFALTRGLTRLTVFHDGYALTTLDLDAPIFELVPGDLVLGDAPSDDFAGLAGWVDELRVLAHGVDPEVACNHAHGTLVGVSEGPWFDRAGAYDPDAHADLGRRVARTGRAPHERYACLHDHTSDQGVLHALPPGVVGVREAVIFPEGPLRHDAPRPDSANNAFCLSCHHQDGRGGLGLGALAYDPSVHAADDRRRQPMQPPRRVFGNVPAGWLGEGLPAQATDAGPEGIVIDGWVLR